MKRVYSFIVLFIHVKFRLSIIKFNKFDSLIIKTCFAHYLHVTKVYSHTKRHKDLTRHGTITQEEEGAIK